MVGRVFLIAASLVFVLFLPARSVQWIGYVVLLTLGLSYLYSRILKYRLTVHRKTGDLVVYRYHDATVSIVVTNWSSLPVPQLLLTDHPGTLYSGNDNVRFMSLRRHEHVTHSYKIRGMNRGSYRIGPISVRFSDPLGLFPVTKRVDEVIRLIVYPSILPVTVSMNRGLPAGSVTAASRIYEDPTRYRSIREYVPGDELRRISWKASARTGRLHSLEYLPTLSFPVMCVLNLTAGDYERRHRYQHVERTIDATASLIHRLAERGQPVGLVSTGLVQSDHRHVTPWIPVSSNPGQANTLLTTLAQIQASEGAEADIVSLFLSRGSVPFGTRVFYLGPPLETDRVVALATGVGQRSFLRLHYTDENVLDWRMLSVEAVEMYRISEFGRELFIPQT